MQKEKRYKKTSIRDKRSIVRALNTFSKQYNYICCDDSFVDLDFSPITYEYLDYQSNFLKDCIVYSKNEAEVDIRNTNLIIDVIDNMISINRKVDLKEHLKDLVRNSELDSGTNVFIIRKYTSIENIEELVGDINFAKKIFSQIENRILFKNTGIYASNVNSATISSKQILPIPTNVISGLIKELNFVISRLYILEKGYIDIEDIENEIEGLQTKLNVSRRSKDFSIDEIKSEENSSFNHPIDEAEYKESKNEAHLTSQQINQDKHNFINEDEINKLKDLHNRKEKALIFNEEYETDINLLTTQINDLVKYFKVENRLFEKLDEYKDRFLFILLKNEWYENIPKEMIFSFQKKIISYIEDGSYPIEDIQEFWNNNVNEELLEDLVKYFDMEEDVLDYVIMY